MSSSRSPQRRPLPPLPPIPSTGPIGRRGLPSQTRKALSLRQPWPWLILHMGKDVENRSWATPYRGELLIHAGQAWDEEIRVGSRRIDDTALNAVLDRYGLSLDDVKTWAHAHDCHTLNDVFLRGGIVGRVTLTGCVRDAESRWAIDGQYHWTLRAPQPLPFIPCRGQLGVFEVDDSGEH